MQIAIVLYPRLTALDAIGPYEVLRFIPGAEIRFVGAEVGPVAADGGVLFIGVTHTFEETPSPDIVLVPGSAGATATAMVTEELTAWLRKVHEATRWTTSVCSGALILAAAGLLEGQPATTHWVVQSALRAVGAQPQPDKRIVRSGRIVTAAGVSAGLDLALWIAGEVAGHEQAEAIQLMIEYDPEPPFDAGHPSKVSKPVKELAREQLIKASMNRREALAIPKVAWHRALAVFRSRVAR